MSPGYIMSEADGRGRVQYPRHVNYNLYVLDKISLTDRYIFFVKPNLT